MCRIFTELWTPELQNHSMRFFGTMIVIVTNEIPHELFSLNLVIF